MAKKKKEAAADEEEAGKSKKMLIVVVALVLIGGGAAYKFVLAKPKATVATAATASASASASAEPKGPVQKLDTLTMNLADSHYLQLGLALQLPETLPVGATKPDVSEVDDTAILYFGSRTYGQLQAAGGKEKAKKALLAKLRHEFGKDVVQDVYFTNFIMQ